VIAAGLDHAGNAVINPAAGGADADALDDQLVVHQVQLSAGVDGQGVHDAHAVGGAARVDLDGATVDGQGVLPNVSDLEQLRRADVGRAASINHADVGIAAGEVEDAVVDHGGGVERSAGDVG